MPEMLNTQQDQRPVPDPTLLTSQLVREAEARIEKLFQLQLDAMNARFRGLDDRYAMQTKALDAAFTAQTTAMDAAFAASEKAVAAAMAAAEQALAKSVTLTDVKLAKQSEDLGALREMLNERYATQTKALDAAFVAQQEAMKTSSSVAKEAMTTALQAAKEAVDKANTANEKRFESVNEFRGQLGDIISTMIPRAEANARINAIDDKIIDIKTAIDKGVGGKNRGQESWGMMVGAIGLMLTLATLIILMMN